jgi:imidazolonepropionase-like amidohydrolase
LPGAAPHIFGELPKYPPPEQWRERGSNMSADLILRSGLFTSLDRSNPTATAVAITNGIFTAVGRDHDVMPLAGPSTRTIDLKGRRVLPGLIDNHLHIIRGGLNFNMELRWDGVRSLAAAAMGPGGRWLHGASVRRKAPAHH